MLALLAPGNLNYLARPDGLPGLALELQYNLATAGHNDLMLALLAPGNLNYLARPDGLPGLALELRHDARLVVGDDVVLPRGAAGHSTGRALHNNPAPGGGLTTGGHHHHSPRGLPQLTRAGHHQLARHRPPEVALHHDLGPGRPHSAWRGGHHDLLTSPL